VLRYNNIISVHKRNKNEIHFGYNHNSNDFITFTFAEMIKIIVFDLNNVYFTAGSKHICKQNVGVPMGGFISAPYANCVAIYYEYHYTQSLSPSQSLSIHGTRYMDDLLAFISFENNNQQSYNNALILVHRLVNSYDVNLELECQPEEKNGFYTFLECYANCFDDQLIIKPYQKNFPAMLTTQQQIFLNIQHYHSFTPYSAKFGVLVSTLLRLYRNASRPELLFTAVLQLYYELKLLCYSFQIIKRALLHCINNTNDTIWYDIVQQLSQLKYINN
jgi:hypothetical protein